ncbi:MAG TPA: ribonuclease J [Anaerolineaceae bacterium]|nr:ribonuclease J [Anaerolineaceae bacterium]HOV06335.1 ribonuclease J [Anaerolineaceae bacterium]
MTKHEKNTTPRGNALKIIPLGGLGEVGANMMVYEYDDQILVVDTGLMFPENDMLGIDYIIPDFSYLIQRRDKVKGIIITHGHEDHTGAIRHVLEEINAPIYATPLTRGLLEVKLARNGMAGRAKLETVKAGDRRKIGPFTVDFFHVCHSIPDGVGLGIDTPAGLIVHTGDYKFDHTPVDNWPTDYAKLAEFQRRGVLALLADSTNAERKGWTPSERVVDDAFDKVFREASGRIIIASFASLVSRMQQVGNAAIRYHRKMAFAGISMLDNARIARKLGYLNLPDDLIVSLEEALHMKDSEVVIMCTGSQGEPTSILGRLSTGTHRLFDVKDGDTIVLSSHPIPGNEENVYHTINRLFERGANVIYEAIAPVHVSGHASQEEMKLLMHLTQPQYFIPIHGELRQLKQHAKLAVEIGIPEESIAVILNGQSVEFRDGKMRIAEKVPASYVYVDGSGVGDVSDAVMRDRELLSEEGLVIVNLDMDKYTDQPRSDPEIITRGFIANQECGDLMAGLRHRVTESASKANGRLQKDVEQAVENYLYSETRRRPMVLVNITRS